ncbi:hypothetical protein Hbl1158_14705 [Halobaculum sp. CBA1158]|uniref:hypothetical protein n=1 Tax=Halobaculum sp. CBA1158 TaxID=2904243 RepID=UPI001F223B5C|nr:hypothetical protein [Halobaculum sp. CBA1158]UIO99751.1 hypothetical protein Hbl1158_14705 [Halobaculum sp. CBA1158]
MSGNDDGDDEQNNPWGDTSTTNEGSGPGSGSSDAGGDGSAGDADGFDGFDEGTPDAAGGGDDASGFEQATAVSTDRDAGGDAVGGGAVDGVEPADGDTGESTDTEPADETGREPTPAPDSSPFGDDGPSTAASSAVDQASRSPGETAERRRPEETDPALQGPMGTRNYTQDLVDFEYVFDSGDDFAPQSVNADGIVLTQSGDYVGMARVTPRSWSIHTQEKKHQILQSYQSGFLSSLDFYTQIVCYPTEFDTSEHIDRLEERMRERSNAADESPLVQYGRQLYPRWLTSFIEEEELTQREYYVIVRVDPSSLRQFDESESLSDKVGESAAAFGSIVSAVESLFSSDDADAGEASREECVREVSKRLNQVRSALRQIDVTVDPITDRDEALSVIYHYYNNARPERAAFDVGRRTEFDADTELNVEGFEVDDLMRPDYGDVGEGGEEP